MELSFPTNVDKWLISPNSHPRYKPGIICFCDQIALGRKLPKYFVTSPTTGVDAGIAYYLFNKPQVVNRHMFMALARTAGYVLQYGIFGGLDLAEKWEQTGVVNTYQYLYQLFNTSNQATQETKLESIDNILSTMETRIYQTTEKVRDVSSIDTKTIYNHAGLFICETHNNTDEYTDLNFRKLVQSNKLVIVVLGRNQYRFLRHSRTRVPWIYNRISKSLGVSKESIVSNDPSGSITVKVDKTVSEILNHFKDV